MFELTINGTVFQFKFGMGFLRDINRTLCKSMEGIPNEKQNIGLQYKIGGIIDGDIEALVEVLDIANKTENPRVTRPLLDAYIDDENTDIDRLFEDVLDFLKRTNATKKTTLQLLEMVEKEKAKAAAKEAAEAAKN